MAREGMAGHGQRTTFCQVYSPDGYRVYQLYIAGNVILGAKYKEKSER
jgi:hypothetical protein